ncbi:PDF receptor-like [Saccoglossus kowalevskii]
MQEFTTGHKPPSIGKVKGLCETFEYFRQYTRFCVFSWMFVEGLYLNGMITAAVFQKPNFKLYYFIGWILPLFPVTAWAITMKFTTEQACWFGYVKSPYYWIVEIPRNLILLINLGFLINIIRILVTKLRESNTSETQQLRKAVKAAILLAPLLGVTNLLFLPDNPKSHESRVVIVLYFYGVMIVTPFQGVIVSLLHCFVNGEVRLLLRRKWAGWKSSRQPGGRLRRQSNSTTTDVYRLNSIYSTTETIRMSFVKHSTQLPQQPSSPVLASPSLSANSPSPSPPPSPGGIAGGPDPASAEDVSTSLL